MRYVRFKQQFPLVEHRVQYESCRRPCVTTLASSFIDFKCELSTRSVIDMWSTRCEMESWNHGPGRIFVSFVSFANHTANDSMTLWIDPGRRSSLSAGCERGSRRRDPVNAELNQGSGNFLVHQRSSTWEMSYSQQMRQCGIAAQGLVDHFRHRD